MAIYSPADSAELAAIVSGAGDTIILRSGVTYAASSMPAGLLTPNNITVGITGSARAIISGGVVRADWTFDAPNNVYSRPAVAGNTLGNVTEDGVPMRFRQWDTNIATTAAGMSTGASLPYWSGSMTYDPVARIVYIRPSSGVPADHVYVVSETLNGFSNSNTSTGLRIEGVEVRSVSRHGMVLLNKRDVEIVGCKFAVIGGTKPSSVWVGNGIELSAGVWGADVSGCEFEDIFDSAVTSQLYEGAPAQIGSHRWAQINAKRCGLHVVEVSCQTANQTISDIETADVTSLDHGLGWSGDRNGAVMCNLTQGSAVVTRSFARNVNGTNQRRLYLGRRTGGVCGIEDSTGVGTYGVAPVSNSAGGLAGQVDLHRNLADNLGAPTADGGVSQWVLSAASMRDTFRSVIV